MSASARLRSACSSILLLLAAGCASVSAEPCARIDLGQFSICAPSDWKLTSKGIDSLAGSFVSADLKVDFDFGLNSDPLRVPDGATEIRESQQPVDGLAARHVSYIVKPGASPVYTTGIHFPSVRAVSMGSLKLTMLARSAMPTKLQSAELAFASIRFKTPGS